MSFVMSNSIVGRNRNLNKVWAGFIWFFALLVGLLGVLVVNDLGRTGLIAGAIFWGLCGALVFWGWRVWNRSARAGAEVRFHDGGFHLNVRTYWRQFAHDLRWSDVERVDVQHGGYGHRIMVFHLTHDAGVRLGLVRETTRKNAPSWLVGRKLWLPISLTELSSDDLLKAFQEAAEGDGYAITKEGWREYLVMSVVRYSVVPRG